MAITVRSTSTLALGTRTNSTITKPTSAVTGDVIVVALDLGGTGAAAPTPPSGWSTFGTTSYSDGSYVVRLGLYGKPYDGAASWAWTHASGSSQAFAIAYQGVDTTTMLDVAATTAASNSIGGAANATAPGQAIATAGAHSIIARGSWDGAAITPPSGWTERFDSPVLWVGDRDWSTGGPTGDVAVDAGDSGLAFYWGIVMASLRPAGAGGTPLNLAAVPAQASAAMPTPTASVAAVVSGGGPMAATMTMPAPVLSMGLALTAAAAHATATFPAPVLTVSNALNLAAAAAHATAAMAAPTITAGLELAAVAAHSTVTMPKPTLAAPLNLAAVPAKATATMPLPAITGTDPAEIRNITIIAGPVTRGWDAAAPVHGWTAEQPTHNPWAGDKPTTGWIPGPITK